MRRYFFHVQDGRYTPDRTGTELSSTTEVRRHAIEMAATILSSQNKPAWETIEWQITCLDDDGETVFTLNFYGESQEAAAAQ